MSAAPVPRSRSSRWVSLRRLGAEVLLLLVGGILLAGLVLLAGPPVLSWGERRAYQADQALLQEAVVAYRRTPQALRPWPTLSGRIGEPVVGALEGFQCDESDRQEVCPWIDIEALATARFLSSPEAINSADSAFNVTATNAPSGSYGWYVNDEGKARSRPPFSPKVGYP